MPRASRRVFLGVSGGAALHAFLARTALADLAQWDPSPAIPLGSTDAPAYTPLKMPVEGVNNEYPVIASGSNGRPWMAWVDASGDWDSIRLAPIDGGSAPPRTLNHGPGQAIHPRALATSEGVAVVWAECRAADDWRIMAAVQADSSQPELLEVSQAGRVAMHPALACDGRHLWFVWEEKSPGAPFAIVARPWSSDKGFSPCLEVARLKSGDCRRPTIACSGNTVYIAYDRFDGLGAINIELAVLRAGGINRRPLTQGPGLSMAPDIAAAPGAQRLWIAWHTNIWTPGEWDIPKWFQLAALDHDRLLMPSVPPPGRNRDMTGTVQGFEFVRLVATPGDVVHVLGRASHNFYIQTWSPTAGWSPLMRLPKDGWGGRGQHLEAALGRDRTLLVARRDLQGNAAGRITGLTPYKPCQAPLKPASPAVVESLRPAPRRIEFDPWGDYKYYFGDIHGHTWISDGCGDVDEYYIMRRDYYRLDFASVTDHDYFVGNGVTRAEWAHIKAITEHFDEPGRFVTLHGQEWTTARYPDGAGHKNIYSASPDIPLLDHRSEECNTGAKVIARVREMGGIAIPHHIGWTGMDWENFDPQVTPVIEIVSVHGAYEYMGNRPIAHRGGLKGHFVQDGWARGLKFGLIGGTDCHGLLYQHGVAWKRDPYRAGWAAILAKNLTRPAVLEALRARRCYATSGIWARLLFEVNGHVMGEEFEDSGPLKIRVECDSESPIEYLEIVRNNEVIYSFGGEGHASKFTFEDKPVPAGTAWYYLRVTCRDGNMAWSSPVWVTRSG